MDRRRIGFLLMGAGIVIALLVSVLVYLQTSEAAAIIAAQPTRWVAVAAVDIPERQVIAANQVALIKLPEEAVPPGSANYLPPANTPDVEVEIQKQAMARRIENQFTPQRIYKGEVINAERLGKEAGKNTPSYDLPEGRVAYVFPLRVAGGSPPNDRLLVAFLNAVRPGDFIDIFYSSIEYAGMTREEQDRQRLSDANFLVTRRIMQNVKVANVGFFPDATGKAAETGRDDRYITLEVTPDDALVLKWMKDAATLTGNLEFVLRSPKDVQPFAPTTIDYPLMQRQFGIGTGR